MKLNLRHVLSRSVRAVALALAVTGIGTVPAQADNTKAVEKTFTVCPLNVDGLPTKILNFEINPDGKGADGATDIGNYLKAKGIDVLAFSEDFNYHTNLIAPLADDYTIGTYRGGLTTENYDVNIRFNTDGLEFLTKTATATFRNESWTEWATSNGKFTNGADGLIRKGYRYYTVDLGDGVYVDFYTMHMDAETDAADNAARASQWTQLCNAIKEANTGRPVIVMGDTNSRYTRDDILNLFTTPLSDLYDVKDVWVEKCKNGTYPTLGSDALMVDQLGYQEGEIVDKVIYLNPKDATLALTANTITFDKDGYVNASGEQLGDHVPVIVSFTAKGTVTVNYEPSASTDFWRGETLVGNDQEVYLYNVGQKMFISHDSNPVVTDVNNAPTWFIHNESNGYTINSDIYRLYCDVSWGKWSASLKKNSGATTFTIEQSTSQPNVGAYKLKKEGSDIQKDHYFSISDGSYDAAQTADKNNDWLFISKTQKTAYDEYVNLYNEALGCLDEREDLNDELKTVLEETGSANYNDYSEVKEKLESIIAKYQKLDVKITSAKYATTCLPWNGEVPAGVTVYIATQYSENANGVSSVHVEKYDSEVLPKGVGFLLYSDNEGTYTFKRTKTAADYPTENILSGTYKKMANATLDFTGHDYMLLGNKSKGVGFYRLDASSYIPAYRAYILRGKTTSADQEYAAFNFGDPTAIEGTKTDADATVTAIYGISGERRNALSSGVNVVKMSDGSVKKIIVK